MGEVLQWAEITLAAHQWVATSVVHQTTDGTTKETNGVPKTTNSQVVGNHPHLHKIKQLQPGMLVKTTLGQAKVSKNLAGKTIFKTLDVYFFSRYIRLMCSNSKLDKISF